MAKNKSKNNLTVIDFFCGAGGFSEGFRQQGYEIILGVDFWQPAISTYNHNFNKEFQTKNVLDFYDSIEEIEKLPNSDVIIGSPPCVSFSSSNKSGKADKEYGLRLTESFLRIIAVKKHQPKSKLKAWFMENVENSKKYLKESYTFSDLNLTAWARGIKINPNQIAIQIEGNNHIINSANYGSFQSRKRLITGEIIKKGKFIVPKIEFSNKAEDMLPNFKSIGMLLNNFPSPYDKFSERLIKDPSYDILIPLNKITDHFYDTGVYESDWDNSKYLKTNHPYMGKMSFPEDINNPSRTITATKIANSREAIIYKCELNRIGNGQYRTPTVREAAIIMGFPITYQFIGSENTKWKLVGNAVCPSVSRSLAKTLKEVLFLKSNSKLTVFKKPKLDGVLSLNTFSLKTFDKPPIKNKGSRFRRHPFKAGNMTIALSNYDIEKNEKTIGKWKSTVFYGTGEGFGISKFKEGDYKKLESTIKRHFDDGEKFIAIINNGFSEKIADKALLQKMYEEHKSIGDFLEPTKLINEVAKIVEKFDSKNEVYEQSGVKFFEKDIVPKKQLYALYAINKIITTANNK